MQARKPPPASALRPIPELVYETIVRSALREDIGMAGDLTTAAIVGPEVRASGRITSRAAGRVAGLSVAALAFRLVSPRVEFRALMADGEPLSPGSLLASVAGPAADVLTGERVALNFLAHLSGVATATARLVGLVEGTGARICCTRKTTPGLRALEKYAVRAGGGVNHRFALDDGILIKDNHIAVAGGVGAAVSRARAAIGHMVKIEVEVDTLEQLDEALAHDIDAVLLDNMTPAQMREAVQRIGGRAIAEASGGITQASVRAIADSGVDLISSGAITHSAPSLDIGLDFER